MSGELTERRDPATDEPLRPGAHGRYLPFEKGHTRSVKHGSYLAEWRLSADPHVAELADAIRSTQAVSHPADEGAVQRLALVYWRIERSAAALDQADQAIADAPLAAYADGRTALMRLREDHARWIREAGRIEADLARTPASRGKLGLHLATARRALTVVELHEAAAAEEAARDEVKP